MKDPAATSGVEEDRAVIAACSHSPTQRAWARFFEHFEPRLTKWIRGTLRDSTAADWEDVYQSFAEKLLLGQVLSRFDLNRNPEPYLARIVQNHARKHHERKVHRREEPFDETVAPTERLQMIADQADPADSGDLALRLMAALERSRLKEKQLTSFLAWLKHKKIQEVARETGFSKSAVQRYLVQVEIVAHQALGVPYRKPKKKLRSSGKSAS